MSYTIEYNKIVYTTEYNGEKQYALLIRQGENNVWTDENQRVKSWYLEATGSLGDLWKEIGRRAGCTDGGGLQKSTGWTNTERYEIEEYIKQYRSKIKNAKPLEDIFDKFFIEAFIYIKDDFSENKNDEPILRDFIRKYNMKKCSSYYYDEKKIGYALDIVDVEILKDFFFNMPTGYKADFNAGFSFTKKKKWRGNRYC